MLKELARVRVCLCVCVCVSSAEYLSSRAAAIMPSMSTSHGGVLYYVVKIPKRRQDPSPDRTSSSLFLDENAITSTPISAYQQCGYKVDDE